MIAIEQLREAKKAFMHKYPGIMTGIGDQCIRIYVNDNAMSGHFPNTIMHVPIEVKNVGEIKAL